MEPNVGRLAFLDALRGIGALAVTWFHFAWMTPLREPLTRSFAGPLFGACQFGHLGVPLFFALSGFVIAHSLRDAEVTAAYFARFALRRSLRLDPPYWAAIALAVLLSIAGRIMLGPSSPAPPTAPAVVAHALYLQGILGLHDIASQFWTLPYEVQFYIVACALLGLEAMLRRRAGGHRLTWLPTALAFGPPCVLSMVFVALELPTHGFFIGHWHAFFAGVLACWALSGRASRWLAASYIVALIFLAARMQSLAILTAALAAGTMLLVGLAGGLATWGTWRPLQWLGRISYSLYLTHFVGTTLCKLAASRFAGSSMAALLSFAAATILSLVVAATFHRFVEAPSMRLARDERVLRVVQLAFARGGGAARRAPC